MKNKIEPIMINAALVSAQNRKRLFWTNIPGVTQPEDRNIYLKDILETGDVDRLKSYCIDANYHKGANWEQYINKGRRQLVIDNTGNEKLKSNTVRSSGRSSGINDRHNWDTIRIEPVALRNRGEGKKPEYNGTNKANSLTTVQTDSMVEQDTVIRKLTPTECERLQGMPDNWTNPTDDISNSQRYKMCGNAFNVDVVAHILLFIKE